ncbi:MAG: hypothetical protein JNK67_18410 [Alphaproteobacteria bacterium]|nr:hypothetical protein [Alphaproteobacteria bacterium]
MASSRTSNKRPASRGKAAPAARKAAKRAKPVPGPAAATAVSAKAFAAALARIDALERRLASLAALPIRVGAGGDVTIEAGATLTLRAPKIELEAAATLQAQSGQLSIATGLAAIDSGMVRVSGVVKCDTLQTNTVIASSYTPGAGNVW